MLRISASTICWVHDSLEDAARKARACGFKAIEPLTFPTDLFPLHGDLRQVKVSEMGEILENHDLTLAALHLGAITTSSEEMRRLLTDYARRAIAYAAEMRCSVIVEGGPKRDFEPFVPFLKSLQELIPSLESKGIRIALENHHKNWIQYIQDYEHIFQHIDHPLIGITLDTGHFTSSGVNPVEVVRTFPDKIFHVHIKDHIGTQSVPLGQGETDNFAVASALKEISYSGYLSQELEVPENVDSDKAAQDGYSYMFQLARV